ncbi:MAG: RloB domain-containing protein, partial [Clostridia bacterium]|nr:RloB domain-containing protein [Clostridia bacterium]
MKRIQKQKKIRDTVLIITNGRQTEKNYFNSITNSYKSMFTIKVVYKNAQPDELVSYAISLDENLYNQIWCVFDIDDTYAE